MTTDNLGEYAIAAYYTASYVDAPFDLLPVNTLTKPIDDVWVKFRELSMNVPLFRPNISPSSLSDFPNRFLRLSEAQKRRHNSEIFKFWNQTARQLWEALTRRPSPENPSPPIAESAYKYLLRDAYGTSVLESFEALEQRADNEIGVPLHQHAGSSGKLLTPNSMVSCIDRLNGRRIIFGWSKQLEDYMTGSLKQSGKVLLADEPPFTQWLDPID